MAVKTRLRKTLLKKTKGKCFYCGKPLSKKRKGRIEKATIDHYVPKAAGGSSGKANLVPACQDCNGRKGRTMPDEFTAAK